jgi:DNA repair protein RadC
MNKKKLERLTKKELIDLIVSENRQELSAPNDLYNEILENADSFRFEEVEYFLIATLDSGHKLIKLHTISQGSVNRTLVHPREVFRAAIKDNAVAIFAIHNHPGGSLKPSEDDLKITRRLKSAGEIIGIKVLDHLIISRNGYHSFLEHDIL